jgi:hypothetical protein
MATSVLEILSCSLDRVTLYQPVGAAPLANLAPWVNNGFLDIRIPFAGIVDENVVTAEFTNWKTWGSMHRDADMAYFSQMGNSLSPAEPLSPKLASQIKDRGKKAEEKTNRKDLASQLFLLLAQDFDLHSFDIQERLIDIAQRNKALEDFFSIDSPEEKKRLVPEERFSQANEDLGALMTESRMIAWNHLFQKDPAPTGVLVTDSPAALDFLLEDQDQKVKVLHYRIAHPPDASAGFPWRGCLAPLFKDLLTKPWDEQLKRQAQKATSRILAVTEVEKRAPEGPAGTVAAFHWYLVPHVQTAALVNQQCKKGRREVEKEDRRNTLVGLVKMDGPDHTG